MLRASRPCLQLPGVLNPAARRRRVGPVAAFPSRRIGSRAPSGRRDCDPIDQRLAVDMPGIFPDEFEANDAPHHQKDPDRARSMTRGVSDKSYPHQRPRARSERPWPRALSPDPPDPDIVRARGARADRAFRKAARDMMAWAGRRLWLAVRTAIRAIRMSHHEQVHAWECVLLTSGGAPLTAAVNRPEFRAY